jgi:elongation factor P--(R)-beta-lysine ligase
MLLVNSPMPPSSAAGEAYPLDEDFLAALPLMPAASGIALGFDRLVMLAAGKERISDVMFTPWIL